IENQAIEKNIITNAQNVLIEQQELSQTDHEFSKPFEDDDDESEVLIGMARIYSGKLKKGDRLHLLKPRYSPNESSKETELITISNLYLLMGRDIEELDIAYEGCLVGITGLEDHISKTGTLSSTLLLPSI